MTTRSAPCSNASAIRSPAFRSRARSSRQPLAAESKSRASRCLAAVKKYGREAGVGAMARLYHARDPQPARLQVGHEAAQDGVGILMRRIDQGGKIALCVE